MSGLRKSVATGRHIRGSVAAHVREASRARSNAEFCSKLGGVSQEADEAQIWMELLPREECGVHNDKVLGLENGSSELIAIMTTVILRTSSR
ncbi:MAG: four helix bundle protein [Alphaproteobacteria bacterium]|nr:MAG: four helix bundle protein [Alphaproteobacteria bacterium]